MAEPKVVLELAGHEVAVSASYGKATSAGKTIGTFYNYGCGGTGGNAGGEAAANGDPSGFSYYEYCCCSVQ